MKYGMNLLLWTADVTEKEFPLLQSLKQWGYDGVELPIFNMDERKFADLGRKLDDLGLERTAVTVCPEPGINPISDDPQVRDAALRHLKSAIDMCRACGATHLCGPLHSTLGHFVGRGRTDDEWKWGQETLRQAADHAQQAGITLVLEYLNRFECYFLNDAESCARFVREADHPHLRMMYDTFHANIEEKDLAQAIRGCADVSVHVHISENDRSTPGEGHVDWDTTFRTLKEVNYDGWLVTEAFGLSLPELAAATKIWRRMYPSEDYLAKNALEFMKSRWQA